MTSFMDDYSRTRASLYISIYFQVWLVMGIIAWEGVSRQLADLAYDNLKDKLPKFGLPLEVNHLN